MTPNDDQLIDPLLDPFSDWLDALVEGKSTPKTEPRANAELSALTTAANQFHGLDQQLVQRAVAVSPRKTTWEELRMAQQLPGATVIPPPISLISGRKTRRQGFAHRINVILSIAAVIALLVAAASTAWLNRDNLGFGGGHGNNNDGPPSELAAVTLPNGDTVQVAYEVPSEEDCTVAPLTVDQVMIKLSSRNDYGSLSQARATAYAVYGTPLPGSEGSIVYPLEEPMWEELAAAQREWLACSLFGTPLQRWALESHNLVQAEIMAAYMPFFDLEQVRVDLERLANGEDVGRFLAPTITADGYLPMLPSYGVGGYNYKVSDSDAQITVLWTRGDGSFLINSSTSGGDPADDPDLLRYINAPAVEQQLPNAWGFIRDPETGDWLLNKLDAQAG